jgi:hypothetical protein
MLLRTIDDFLGIADRAREQPVSRRKGPAAADNRHPNLTSRDCLTRSRSTTLLSTSLSLSRQIMADSSTTPNEETKEGFSARLFEGEQALDEQNVYVSLTYDELNANTTMDRVKSPKAGAVVLFSGTVFHNSISSSSPHAH